MATRCRIVLILFMILTDNKDEYQVRYRQTRMTFGTALGTEQIT